MPTCPYNAPILQLIPASRHTKRYAVKEAQRLKLCWSYDQIANVAIKIYQHHQRKLTFVHMNARSVGIVLKAFYTMYALTVVVVS
jgi:hypothetical protein